MAPASLEGKFAGILYHGGMEQRCWKFREQAAEINRLILTYNLEVPPRNCKCSNSQSSANGIDQFLAF